MRRGRISKKKELREDSFVRAAGELLRLIGRNWGLILTIFVASGALTFGVWITKRKIEKEEERIYVKLENAISALTTYETGRDEEARKTAENTFKELTNTKVANIAKIYLGYMSLMDGENKDAVKYLEDAFANSEGILKAITFMYLTKAEEDCRKITRFYEDIQAEFGNMSFPVDVYKEVADCMTYLGDTTGASAIIPPDPIQQKWFDALRRWSK